MYRRRSRYLDVVILIAQLDLDLESRYLVDLLVFSFQLRQCRMPVLFFNKELSKYYLITIVAMSALDI